MKIASLTETSTQMGQIVKFVRVLAGAGVTPEHLQRAIDSKLARANLAEFFANGCPKVDFTHPVPKARGRRKSKGAAPTDTTHLRFLESVELPALPSATTIAQSGDVFTGWIDPNFQVWGTNVPSVDIVPATALIYEMKKDGNFLSLFSSLGEGWRSRQPTQSQIVTFCQKYPDKLRQDGYGTFFPFQVGEEKFVARVYLDASRLGVVVFRLDRDRVWYADHPRRVVVLQ